MIKSGRSLPCDSPRLRFPPLEDLLSHFLGGRLDVLHFLANPSAGCFVSPGGLGDVFFHFLNQSFQCVKFVHGSSLLKRKTLQRGGRGVNSGKRRAGSTSARCEDSVPLAALLPVPSTDQTLAG